MMIFLSTGKRGENRKRWNQDKELEKIPGELYALMLLSENAKVTTTLATKVPLPALPDPGSAPCTGRYLRQQQQQSFLAFSRSQYQALFNTLSSLLKIIIPNERSECSEYLVFSLCDD